MVGHTVPYGFSIGRELWSTERSEAGVLFVKCKVRTRVLHQRAMWCSESSEQECGGIRITVGKITSVQWVREGVTGDREAREEMGPGKGQVQKGAGPGEGQGLLNGARAGS